MDPEELPEAYCWLSETARSLIGHLRVHVPPSPAFRQRAINALAALLPEFEASARERVVDEILVQEGVDCR